MSKVKTIGVLTSGGDAPGMNVVVRAVVRAGINAGMKVMGIRYGYNGLINGDIAELDSKSVSNIIQRGGTTLFTARCLEFKTEEGMNKAIQTCKDFNLDGIVVIGGDGSFRGASELSSRGIPCVGIPGTIDNDISASDYTIGYDTALNTVIENVDKLRDTSESHNRCTVVEVMGKRSGWIALEAGIATGATAIVVPELDFNFERDVVSKIEKASSTGMKNFIVIIAEGVGGVYGLAQRIEERTGIETRTTILGHVQRGGSPSARDRVVGSQMGYYAIELLKNGTGDRVVVTKNSKIVDFDIHEALKMKKPIDMELYNIAANISV